MNFLLIRFSSIGDVVLTTFIPDAIKKKYPDAQIFYASSTRFISLIEEHPNIDRVLVYESMSLRQIAAFCKANQVHIALDLHGSLRSRLLCLFLRLKNINVLRYKKFLLRRWMMVKFKRRKPEIPTIRERYSTLLRSLHITGDDSRNHLFPGAALPDSLSRKLPSTYLVWCIGATHATKKFPSGRIPEIAEQLPIPVVLVGGKAEQEEANNLSAGYKNNIISVCGECTLQESAFIIRNAALIISNDTGMMHLAAASGKPLISIWGGTVPELGFAPENHDAPHVLIQNNTLNCRPCHSKGLPECPLGHFNCMRQLETETILAAAKRLLSSYL